MCATCPALKTSPAANTQIDARRCSGFKFQLREVDREELEENIITANADDEVDGIIVYYPIFGNRRDQYLQQILDVSKDVEGLSHRYIFNMYQNIRFLDDQKQQKSILVPLPSSMCVWG